MRNTYCGACRGERGCGDCKAVGSSVCYTGLTEYFAERTAQVLSEDTTDMQQSKIVRCYNELLLAADLGTTTLAFVCADERGEVLASYGRQNPQRKVAADVIGRIDAALHGQGESLSNEIREALVKGFLFVHKKGKERLHVEGIEAEALPIRIAIAGNTTMQHLLLGYPLDTMAKAPFVPYAKEKKQCLFSEIFGETAQYDSLPLQLKRAEVTVFPCLSAFVGGDIVAGANAVFEGKRDGNAMLIDLGTNGELLLSANGSLYGTATAMGSAIEGGRYAYASDLFRRIADALQQGIMDETGLLCEPYFSEGYEGLLQEDVREFQLAKGALRVGIELLCAYAGVECSQIDCVFLAGGLGQYCDRGDLLRTGMLPEEFAGKIVFVGNSCMGGLLLYLKNKNAVLYCEGESLNLAEQPEFEEIYYRFMNFEK